MCLNFIFSIVKNKAQIFLSFACIIIIVVVCGGRYYSDTDYGPYVELFLDTPSIENLNFDDLQTLYGEPGYLIFSSLTKYFSLEFVFITLVFSFVSICVKTYVASRFVFNYSFVIAIYLCLHFITVEFIELRWSLSSALVIAAIAMLHYNRWKSFFTLILIASLFHYFSLLFIVVYLYRLLNIKQTLLIFFCAFFASMSYKLMIYGFYFDVDSNIYMLRRLFRYINDPQSSVGLFSFLRIILYVGFYAMFNRYNYSNKCSGFEVDLDKLFILIISCALFLSIIPLLYFRTMVVADFYAITYIVLMINKLKILDRVGLYFILLILFCLWNLLDVLNYFAAGYIFEYSTWFRFI